MTESTPSMSEEQEKAAEVESYGGVPMTEQELGQVWEAPDSGGGDVKPGGDVKSAPDVTSDPGMENQDGGDWSDEGGATAEGPATDTDDVANAGQEPPD